MELDNSLIKKLIDGPSVLLIGQKYLSLASGKDILLERIQKKFSVPETQKIGYDVLFNFNMTDYASISAWLENLCKDLNGPLWLDTISKIPWSAVYTSCIDTIISRTFETDWRRVQPVYDDKFKITDPRNKHNLHLTYLFGCISQEEPNKRSIFSALEKIKRRPVCNVLLNRIPETVTPKGVFIVEALLEHDWLSIEDFYATVSRLSSGQTYLFSFGKKEDENPLIKDLVESGKVIPMPITLAKFIGDAESTLNLEIKIPEPESYFGKWISISDRKIKVPSDLLNKISRTAVVVSDNLFLDRSSFSEDENYSDFRNFLASSNLIPEWTGYTRDFAFKRDYFEILLEKIKRAMTAEKNEIPIILCGQASSGKTVSLGLLTYIASQKLKIPTLFIEKRYQKIDEIEIDNYCRWCEENNASKTLIVWDGMVDIDNYYQLISRLNARGRNVIIVGSSYIVSQRLISSGNFVECPIYLSSNEKKHFSNFIKNIDPLLSGVLEKIDENNFLSMLYRYLPYTRNNIRLGLKSEFDFFSKSLREIAIDTVVVGSIGEALVQAGVVEPERAKIFNEFRRIDDEEVNLSDKLIFSITVPGEYGLTVPFELLLRSIGYEVLSSELFQVLNSVRLIRWIEDDQGNISIGPRTAVEAKILCQFLGSKRAKVEYIKILLGEIKANPSDYYFESNPEIQFAVELLNNIGPNSPVPYTEYLYEIAEVLRQLRESRQAYHPRLVLKESSFIRELVKGSTPLPESKVLMLDRAEEIVRAVLDQLYEFKERTITNYLRIELATILGTKTIEYIEDGLYDEAISNYQLVKDLNHVAFAINPDNYRALDVLTWTTKALIRNDVLSNQQKMNAEADILHLLEMAESEGISDLYREDFYKRKMEMYQLVGDTLKSDQAFNQLAESGSTLGFYIRAKGMLGEFDMNDEGDQIDISKTKDVINYLTQNFDFIQNDSRCVYLLLKAWWMLKTKSKLFSKEKQTLELNKGDWEFCMTLIDHLLSISEIYYSASILYLKGVTEFHLERTRESMETFKILDAESDFSSYGRRRVIKTFLASTFEGKPRVFNGEVKRTVSLVKNEKVGEIYVSELRQNIPFVLNEFGKSFFQSGEKLDQFFIGFNFRGPIAVPLKYQ